MAVLPQLLSDVYSHMCAGQKFLPFIHQRLCLNQNEVWWFTEWQAPPKEKALKLYSMLLGKGKNVVYHLFLALLDSSSVLPNHYVLANTLKKKCETSFKIVARYYSPLSVLWFALIIIRGCGRAAKNGEGLVSFIK